MNRDLKKIISQMTWKKKQACAQGLICIQSVERPTGGNASDISSRARNRMTKEIIWNERQYQSSLLLPCRFKCLLFLTVALNGSQGD